MGWNIRQLTSLLPNWILFPIALRGTKGEALYCGTVKHVSMSATLVFGFIDRHDAVRRRIGGGPIREGHFLRLGNQFQPHAWSSEEQFLSQFSNRAAAGVYAWRVETERCRGTARNGRDIRAAQQLAEAGLISVVAEASLANSQQITDILT